MAFTPLGIMLARVDRYDANSDSALFNELLYAGEYILKITTAAFVSAIEDDRENHLFRLMHSLVRADSVGMVKPQKADYGLIIIVLVLLLGGGGWYGRGRWF